MIWYQIKWNRISDPDRHLNDGPPADFHLQHFGCRKSVSTSCRGQETSESQLMWCQIKAKTISDPGQHPNKTAGSIAGRPTCEKVLSLCLWPDLHATILRYQESHHLNDMSVGTDIFSYVTNILHRPCRNAKFHCPPGEAWGIDRSWLRQASHRTTTVQKKVGRPTSEKVLSLCLWLNLHPLDTKELTISMIYLLARYMFR